MSSAEVIASSFTRRRAPAAPLLLLLGSLVLYIGVAFSTGQTRMHEVEGVVGLLQRMVALGICAIGQTFVILAGSIDLSVANLISVGAVLASFIMQGRPEMMFVAVIVVLAVSAIVGLINGVLVSRLQVSPFIATLGSGLVLQGLLSASFTNFAGSVPIEFQALRLWRPRPPALFGDRPLSARDPCLDPNAGDKIRGASLRGRRQRRRGASCGHPHRSRDHRRACAVQPDGRREWPLSREPPALRRAVGRT